MDFPNWFSSKFSIVVILLFEVDFFCTTFALKGSDVNSFGITIAFQCSDVHPVGISIALQGSDPAFALQNKIDKI